MEQLGKNIDQIFTDRTVHESKKPQVRQRAKHRQSFGTALAADIELSERMHTGQFAQPSVADVGMREC